MVGSLVWVDVEDWEEKGALSDGISESDTTLLDEDSVNIREEKATMKENVGDTEMMKLDLPFRAKLEPL